MGLGAGQIDVKSDVQTSSGASGRSGDAFGEFSTGNIYTGGSSAYSGIVTGAIIITALIFSPKIFKAIK